jgi:hypothetical protein
MTREKRLETRNEICKAHFNIGSDDISKLNMFDSC